MTLPPTNESTLRKPLRVWPGVVAVVLQWLVRFAVPLAVPGALLVGLIGEFVGALAILVWWLFFSRALWSERLGAIAVMIVALFATSHLVHPSIATGMMGMMLPMLAIPVLSLALVACAVATSQLSSTPSRWAAMVATLMVACGVFTLLRTGGITGEGRSDLHWRWTASSEERLLARVGGEAIAPPSLPPAAESPDTRLVGPPKDQATPSAPNSAAAESREQRVPVPGSSSEPTARFVDEAVANTDAEWPGFRGPARDGIVRGVRIETDWSQKPPVAMWRRPIGPGWSSFAVRGDFFYTQEQRGDSELVASYKVSTGEPVWRHRDAVRFWESNGGAGPRATPTLSNGRVYTFGATGILNALDARTGAVVWSRNVSSDARKKVPMWGFASSPLVVGDVVIVAASDTLVAYDIASGKPRWFGPAARGGGYSSPHQVTIDGVVQVMLLSASGATSVAPADGTLLWTNAWPSDTTIIQPAFVGDGDVLITTSAATGGLGLRRLAVAHSGTGWSVEERWTSSGLKPYFNDFVIHNGYGYGFDGSILACIDLKDGNRKWKGGRYGNGQLVLLADQDLLLVVSEDGELALVEATPDQFRELARIPAINGKTWNHPVLVRDVLLVRNGEEMAAFRLSLLSPPTVSTAGR